MNKWERELLRKKQALEKEIYHCFEEMVRICETMRADYEDMSDATLQKYLNLDKYAYLEIEDDIEDKYPDFRVDLVTYMQWKERFHERCYELEMFS